MHRKKVMETQTSSSHFLPLSKEILANCGWILWGRICFGLTGYIESILARQLGYAVPYAEAKSLFRGIVGTSVIIMMSVNTKIGQLRGQDKSINEKTQTLSDAWALAFIQTLFIAPALLLIPQTFRFFSDNSRQINQVTYYLAGSIPAIPLGLGMMATTNFAMAEERQRIVAMAQSIQVVIASIVAMLATQAFLSSSGLGMVGFGFGSFAGSLSSILTLHTYFYKTNALGNTDSWTSTFSLFKKLNVKGAKELFNEGLPFAALIFMDFLVSTMRTYILPLFKTSDVEFAKAEAYAPVFQIIMLVLMMMPGFLKPEQGVIAKNLSQAEKMTSGNEDQVQDAYDRSNAGIMLITLLTGLYGFCISMIALCQPRFFPSLLASSEAADNTSVQNATTGAICIAMLTLVFDVFRLKTASAMQMLSTQEKKQPMYYSWLLIVSQIIGLFITAFEKGANIYGAVSMHALAMMVVSYNVWRCYQAGFQARIDNPALLKQDTVPEKVMPYTIGSRLQALDSCLQALGSCLQALGIYKRQPRSSELGANLLSTTLTESP